MNPARIRAYLYLLGATFIWGVAAIVIKLTLKGIEPVLFLTYRFGISGLIGLFFVLRHTRTLRNLFKEKDLLLSAVLYSLLATTVALGFLFWGLGKTTVLSLSLLDLTGPLIVAIFGVVFLKEHFTSREKLGSAIAVSGALLILVGPQFLHQATEGATLLGNFLIFLYILTDSSSNVFLKKLVRRNVSVLFLVNFSFIIAFLTILPIALIKYRPIEMINTIVATPFPYHLGVWFMALISGSLAYFLRGLGQKTIEIGEAGLFGYMISVFSFPLAIIILNEKFTLTFFIGAIIIIIGVLVAEIKKKRYN